MRHGLAEEDAVEPALLDLAYALDMPLVATNDVHFLEADGLRRARRADLHRRGRPGGAGGPAAADRRAPVQDARPRWSSCSPTCPRRSPTPSSSPGAAPSWRRRASRSCRPSPTTRRRRCAVRRPKAWSGGWRRWSGRPGMDDGARESGGRALPRAAGLRARRHRPDEVPGLLPDRLGLHQVGQGRRHARWVRAAARVPARSSPGASTSPISTRCASACCSSASSTPSACRCRTSTSTSARTGAHEVIAYVRDRYGADRVAQIITFGTLQARAALRDVGRVLGLPFGLVDRDLQARAAQSGQPGDAGAGDRAGAAAEGDARDDDPSVARMIDIALQLEGLPRNASTHAAGVVIGDRPLRGAGAALPRPARADALDPVQHEGRREGGPGQVRLPGALDADHARAWPSGW